MAVSGNNALLPRGGARGFPHWAVWQQYNDRFLEAMTAYLGQGAAGRLSDVATRITGSADVFGPKWTDGLPGALAAGRRAAFGINAVTPPGDKSLLQVHTFHIAARIHSTWHILVNQARIHAHNEHP